MSSLSRNYPIAVVGATGNVGQTMLKILHEKKVLPQNIIPIASLRSAGQSISYGDQELPIVALESFDFSHCKIALFSPGATVSAQYAPKAAEVGCWVIDNTSYFRMDEDVPLIVPEINMQTARLAERKIIANPNCSTIQMVMALKPLDVLCGVERVVVSTYQAVSGAGRSGTHELQQQLRMQGTGRAPVTQFFQKQIASNLIPQIDVFLPDGSTKEEWKMVVETQKILDKTMDVVATCVRVPVFNAHSESVYVECEREVDLEHLYEKLQSMPGIRVEEPSSFRYVTPCEADGMDWVSVSRMRYGAQKNTVQMWIVSDNLRKGAALNAIQIAEGLVEEGLV